MGYRFGSTRISEYQARLIERARSAIDAPGKTRLLLSLLRTPDAESGAETVSPEWLSICSHLHNLSKSQLRNKYLIRFVNAVGKLMQYSPAITDLKVDQLRLAFLLGAGASRPEPTNIPTVNELLPDLLARARRLDREDLTGIADFCTTNGIRHIEDLLTAAQLSHYCSRHPQVLRLVNFLLYGQRLNGDSRRPAVPARPTRGPSENGGSVAFLADTLQVLFGLISGRMLPAAPNAAHRALAAYCASHARSDLITTNYDCCMDRALRAEGAEPDYAIDFRNPSATYDSAMGRVRLLKLHGSLNWFYCDSCQDVHLVPIAVADESFLAPPSRRVPYPVIGHCDGCNGLRRPLLVPPQALKFDIGPPLNPLIELATDAFRYADLIVAIGFSFADSDVHIIRALTRAMKANRKSRLVVIDPNFEVSERIAKKLATRVPEFDTSRVLKIVSGCTESLDAFLAGDYVGLDADASSSSGAHVERPSVPVIG